MAKERVVDHHLLAPQLGHPGADPEVPAGVPEVRLVPVLPGPAAGLVLGARPLAADRPVRVDDPRAGLRAEVALPLEPLAVRVRADEDGDLHLQLRPARDLHPELEEVLDLDDVAELQARLRDVGGQREAHVVPAPAFVVLHVELVPLFAHHL